MGQAVGLALAFKGMQYQKAAADAEAQSAREQGELANIQTQQQTVERGRDLARQLASLSSQFSGSGLSGGGATVANFQRTEGKSAMDDISSIKVMGNAQRRKFQLSGYSSKMGGKAAQMEFGAKAGKYAYDSKQAGQGTGYKLI